MLLVSRYHGTCNMDNVSFNSSLVPLSLTTQSTEHLLGLTVASIPLLRPLFKRILVMTTQRSNSSQRTFQKIHGRERGVQVHIAGNNSRKTLRMNDKDITKTTELRMSTETDIEFAQLQKPPSSWSVPERDRSLRGYIHNPSEDIV